MLELENWLASVTDTRAKGKKTLRKQKEAVIDRYGPYCCKSESATAAADPQATNSPPDALEVPEQPRREDTAESGLRPQKQP